MLSFQEFKDSFDLESRQGIYELSGESQFLQVSMAKTIFGYLKDHDGELTDFIPCSFYIASKADSKGQTSIHGYSIDEDLSRLDLFVFLQVSITGETVTPSDVRATRDQAYRFYKRAIDGHHKNLEEAHEAHSAMAQIYDAREDITSIRIFVFSNGESKRAKLDTEIDGGVTIESFVWDIERIYTQVTSGSERDEIIIDFKNDYGAPVPALLCNSDKSGYKCYVGFLSGYTRAEMYKKHSSRLVEQNVRMFLQARGSVNGGIQKTIKDEPKNFLAYNNGMSLTAKSVECLGETVNGQCLLSKVTELQIVNGAQTSGSIFHARQKERNLLSGIWVQFKLTVPDNGQTDPQFYSNISKYANSQNKVKVTDLSANHPFHLNIERLSRSIVTPNRNDGTPSLSHWFYERARGAYLIEKGNISSVAQRNAWERSNPKSQCFTKVDLAKSEVVSWGLPHVVSKGGEKNFSHFMLEVENIYTEINEKIFKEMIARLILFRSTEKIVSELEQGGYRANVVAYSLSYLYLRYIGQINYSLFWTKQSNGLSENLKEQLSKIAEVAFTHISSPPPGISNLSEWAKKKECWDTFNAKTIELNLGPDDGFGQRRKAPERVSGNNLEGAMALPRSWQQIAQWAKNREDFTRKDRGFIQGLIALTANKESLTAAQLRYAKSIWEKADKAGFAFKK